MQVLINPGIIKWEGEKMNFIDLFAGAGGLSEGFTQAGFNPIAHIEINKHASKTLETRSAYHYLKRNNKLKYYYEYQKSYNLSENERLLAREKLFSYIPKDELELVINEGISDKTLPDMFKLIDNEMIRKNLPEVDLIIGGPPCQAYSLLGRARDDSSMENDERNYLYKHYARFLNYYSPRVFVFENVPGILTAKKGAIYKNLKAYLKRVGYNLESFILNSKDFGIPQSRKRVILIGFRKDLDFPVFEFPNLEYQYTISDLFMDLPKLQAGEKYTDTKYSKRKCMSHSIIEVREKNDLLTHHHARTHNPRDKAIYSEAIKKWNTNHTRLKYTDLDKNLITHKNTKSFLDRYKVVAGDLNYSHTVVAHLSKDGHHFIHPDISQLRSITVREAARLQTFPDNYFFEGSRTANYVQVGNAVPPLMAKKIAKLIKSIL